MIGCPGLGVGPVSLTARQGLESYCVYGVLHTVLCTALYIIQYCITAHFHSLSVKTRPEMWALSWTKP